MVFDLVFSYFSLQKMKKNFYYRMGLDQLECFATIIWVIWKQRNAQGIRERLKCNINGAVFRTRNKISIIIDISVLKFYGFIENIDKTKINKNTLKFMKILY